MNVSFLLFHSAPPVKRPKLASNAESTSSTDTEDPGTRKFLCISTTACVSLSIEPIENVKSKFTFKRLGTSIHSRKCIHSLKQLKNKRIPGFHNLCINPRCVAIDE